MLKNLHNSDFLKAVLGHHRDVSVSVPYCQLDIELFQKGSTLQIWTFYHCFVKPEPTRYLKLPNKQSVSFPLQNLYFGLWLRRWINCKFIVSLCVENLTIVNREDWLRKPANIKVENNGAVVYVRISLTVHNPLFFVHKLWLNKSMRCLYWSVSFKMIGMLLNVVHSQVQKKLTKTYNKGVYRVS